MNRPILADRSASPLTGVALKPQHYQTILQTQPPMGFFEVHAENYMGAGGPPHRYLTAIRQAYPLSLHGVGLSIGADGPLDRLHLGRLRALVDRYQPVLVSEHLAWSRQGGDYFNDLLPLPYTDESLQTVCDHVDEIQTALGRRVLIENPSTYLAFAANTWTEADFLAALAGRTGCGLLLDVNNVFVSATNHRQDPCAYIEAFRLAKVEEIHLAGFAREIDAEGALMLIDSHDRPVDPQVWTLFEHTVRRTGPVATLIEWDADVPAWPVLAAQAAQAEAVMRRHDWTGPRRALLADDRHAVVR